MTTAQSRPHANRTIPDTPHEVAAPAARVTVVMVTWNKPADAVRAVHAVMRQADHGAAVDLVVVDNASEPEARAELARAISPTRVVVNRSTDPARPEFATIRDGPARLTLIENAENLGGCGGFNTGMRYIDRHVETDFVWLVDDDIDLPEGALASLLRTAQTRRDAALIGSRTVDLNDRKTTIETTIYHQPRTGLLGPDPEPADPRRAGHDAWRARGAMTGVRDVDVVSACSMLVRWAVAREVGFWDDRFFIYCDDADWCLRMKRAGHAVVLDLDAVVYHTPWFEKLSPTRAYYAQRNAVWMIANTADRSRGLVARRLGALLRDAARAARSREYQRAALLLRTCEDAARGRGGKLTDEPKRGRWNIASAFVRTSAACALVVLAPGRLRGAV